MSPSQKGRAEASFVSDDIRCKLAFQRGLLALLKDTELQDPLLDKAIETLEDIMGQVV